MTGLAILYISDETKEKLSSDRMFDRGAGSRVDVAAGSRQTLVLYVIKVCVSLAWVILF